MKKIIVLFFILASLAFTQSTHKILYSAQPNHRNIVLQCLKIANMLNYVDTGTISFQEIKNRLEAGVYSEDYDAIPGIVGEHYPAPWNLGPSFDFEGYYPFSKVPYGSYRNDNSGWKRGFYHGYDPVNDYRWPGAEMNTVQWANSSLNNFSWDKAKSLYRSGDQAGAYECLGHLLHLLMDLSVPSHVKVVNHGTTIGSIHSGTVLDPDILVLILDEYELALSGGVDIPNYDNFIPDQLSSFLDVLQQSNFSMLPDFDNFEEYFTRLALLTYNDELVNKYYSAPSSQGGWGSVKDAGGNIIQPTPYFNTLPSQIEGRYAQISLRSTVSVNGTIIPPEDMLKLCAKLVPQAVYYGAGLIRHFNKTVTAVDVKINSPSKFYLGQNYPNPFNPATSINYQVPEAGTVVLKVFDCLGNEIKELVHDFKIAGSYTIEFNGSDLPSGIYFYSMTINGYRETKKMTLVK